MAQKNPNAFTHTANSAKEISLAQGKMPPNAIDDEKLVFGILLIGRKESDCTWNYLSVDTMSLFHFFS